MAHCQTYVIYYAKILHLWLLKKKKKYSIYVSRKPLETKYTCFMILNLESTSNFLNS